MHSIAELRKLRNEVSSYECTCFGSKIFIYQMMGQLKSLTTNNYEVKNEYFGKYIHEAVLCNLNSIKDFLRAAKTQNKKIDFKVRYIQYHFHFIIDSCIYANMVN